MLVKGTSAFAVLAAGLLGSTGTAQADARRCGGSPEVCFKVEGRDNIVTKVSVYTTSKLDDLRNVKVTIWANRPGTEVPVPIALWSRTGVTLPHAASGFWSVTAYPVTFCSRSESDARRRWALDPVAPDPCYVWPASFNGQKPYSMGAEFSWGTRRVILNGPGQTIDIKGTLEPVK